MENVKREFRPISKEVLTDVKKQAVEIREQGERDLRDLTRKYKNKKREKIDKLQAQFDLDKRRLSNKGMSDAILAQRLAILEEKNRLIEEFKGRLRDRCRQFIKDHVAQYHAYLKRELEGALIHFSGSVLVHLNARDAGTYPKLDIHSPPSVTPALADRPIETIGGFRLESERKGVWLDNTIENVIELLQDDIKVLFGKQLPTVDEM